MKYKILKRSYGFDCIFCDKRNNKDDIVSSFTTRKKLSNAEYEARIAEEIVIFEARELAEKQQRIDDAQKAKLEARAQKKALAVEFKSVNPTASLQQYIDAVESGAIGEV